MLIHDTEGTNNLNFRLEHDCEIVYLMKPW